MTELDRRLNAFRDDLADEQLRGRVTAQRFAAGEPASIAVAVADVHSRPDSAAAIDTQLLRGDAVTVFERGPAWSWVQAARDSYVGYVPAAALAAPAPAATHVVCVQRSFTYPEPELKTPVTGCLSLATGVVVAEFAETRGNRYAVLDTGEALMAGHVRPAGEHASDYVAVAEMLEHTPYLWGGTSGFGIDCSGLVQIALRMTGRDVVRDTDMQAAALGEPVEPGEGLSGLRRGDLVFWKGHVAILTDEREILHANGRTMIVSREPLRAAVERIAEHYGPPTGFRRP